MPTLTADQLADIRLVTGSNDTITVITDVMIQAQYDLAYTGAPDSDFILPYTYVYVLRRLWGYQRTRVDRTTDHGDRQTRQQVLDNTKALLDYWEGQAGLSGGGILSAGSISLGLDQDEVTLA